MVPAILFQAFGRCQNDFWHNYCHINHLSRYTNILKCIGLLALWKFKSHAHPISGILSYRFCLELCSRIELRSSCRTISFTIKAHLLQSKQLLAFCNFSSRFLIRKRGDAGTGTGGWESSLSNTLSPGDRQGLPLQAAFSKKLWSRNSHPQPVKNINHSQWATLLLCEEEPFSKALLVSALLRTAV